MFGLRGLCNLKQAAKATGFTMIKPVVLAPKFYYSSAVSKMIAAQTGIINPNTITLQNLREMILKSKS